MFKPRSQFVNVSWLLLLLCVSVCSRECVCLCLSAFRVVSRCVMFVSMWVFLLVTAVRADAVMTPHLSPLSVTFSCRARALYSVNTGDIMLNWTNIARQTFTWKKKKKWTASKWGQSNEMVKSCVGGRLFFYRLGIPISTKPEFQIKNKHISGKQLDTLE